MEVKRTSTLRLDARLMMDRWRSLFLCAGVNSGREAALSMAADKKRIKRQSGKNIRAVCKCHFAQGHTVTHNRGTTYYFEV